VTKRRGLQGANPGSFTNSTVVGGAGGDANGTGNTAGDGEPYEIINNNGQSSNCVNPHGSKGGNAP